MRRLPSRSVCIIRAVFMKNNPSDPVCGKYFSGAEREIYAVWQKKYIRDSAKFEIDRLRNGDDDYETAM